MLQTHFSMYFSELKTGIITEYLICVASLPSVFAVCRFAAGMYLMFLIFFLFILCIIYAAQISVNRFGRNLRQLFAPLYLFLNCVGDAFLCRLNRRLK